MRERFQPSRTQAGSPWPALHLSCGRVPAASPGCLSATPRHEQHLEVEDGGVALERRLGVIQEGVDDSVVEEPPHGELVAWRSRSIASDCKESAKHCKPSMVNWSPVGALHRQ